MNTRSTTGLLLLGAALIGLTASSCKSLDNDLGRNVYERELEDLFEDAPAGVIGTTADTRIVIFRENSFVAEPRAEGEVFGRGGHHGEQAFAASNSSQGLRLFREASYRLAEARANSIEGMLALRAAGMSDETIAALFPSRDDWTMMYMNTLDLSRDAIQAELDSGVRRKELESEAAHHSGPMFLGNSVPGFGLDDVTMGWSDDEDGFEYEHKGADRDDACDRGDNDPCEAKGGCDDDDRCEAKGGCDDEDCGEARGGRDDEDCGGKTCKADRGEWLEVMGCPSGEAPAMARKADSSCEASKTGEVVWLTDVTECKADCTEPCCAAPKCDATPAKRTCDMPRCKEAAASCASAPSCEVGATCESESTCEVSVTCEAVELSDITECKADGTEPCCAAPKCDSAPAKSTCDKPCCEQAAVECGSVPAETLVRATEAGSFEGQGFLVYSSGVWSHGAMTLGLATPEGQTAPRPLAAVGASNPLSPVNIQATPEGSFEGTSVTPTAGKAWKVHYSCPELAGQTVDLVVTCLDAPEGKSAPVRLSATFQAELNKKGKTTLKASVPAGWRLVSLEGPGTKTLFAVFL